MASACEHLAQHMVVVRQGALWSSPAWGFEGAPFLNQAVEVAWEGGPDALLARALTIEAAHGRVRNMNAAGYEDRSLDIDLIMWDGGEHQSSALELPHPRMASRRFVLAPLAEHWSDWQHPNGHRVAELLAACADDSVVSKV